MVRKKRGIDPMERVRKEILQSECFQTVELKFKTRDDFEKFAESKITPVVGDLTAPGLGLSPEDRNLLIENCNAMINSAASINFDDPI